MSRGIINFLFKKYLKVSEELFELGRISGYDFSMQQNAYFEAELKYYGDQYRLFIKSLEFYGI